MDKLCYAALEKQEYSGYLLKDAPERVLQFGEGGFLRAFVDYFIDLMNEKAGFHGKVVVVQPIAAGLASAINEQEGLYTLLLRGQENGQKTSRRRVISCLSRCLNPYEDYQALLDCAANQDLRFLVSNTTEAGIVFDPACRLEDTPPDSFPAKLTAFLYRRWQLGLPGFLILSCELIDHNGAELRRCVEQYIGLWKLEADFLTWIRAENQFCSTLVDRIVTGYPRAEAEALSHVLGYQDQLIDTGELFGLWVIEGPQSIREELPYEAAGLPILVTGDHTPYKQRKVRILNGAHTAMVLGAYLAGQDIVRNCMEDEGIRGFLNRAVYEEIIPTLDLPAQELDQFAQDVFQRFLNPYIDHALLSIALNSTAKWRARVMPSLLEFVRRKGCLPACLTVSFAAYLAFYRGGTEQGSGCLLGRRGAEVYEIRDDGWVLDFFYSLRGSDARSFTQAVVENERMWGRALADLEGFAEAAAACLERIEAVGIRQVMEACLS